MFTITFPDTRTDAGPADRVVARDNEGDILLFSHEHAAEQYLPDYPGGKVTRISETEADALPNRLGQCSVNAGSVRVGDEYYNEEGKIRKVAYVYHDSGLSYIRATNGETVDTYSDAEITLHREW